MATVIRDLTPADAAAYRRLRLEMLEQFPAAYGADLAEAQSQQVQDYAERIAKAAPGAIVGAFDGRPLIATAGLLIHRPAKQRHIGVLWGMYVQPAFQRTGIGRALVEAVIARARLKVRVLQLGVAVGNAPARVLYHRLGFRGWGVEPRATCLDGVFHDQEHMSLDLDA